MGNEQRFSDVIMLGAAASRKISLLAHISILFVIGMIGSYACGIPTDELLVPSA